MLVCALFGALIYEFKGVDGRVSEEVALSRADTRMAAEDPEFGEWLRCLPRDVARRALRDGTEAIDVAVLPCNPVPPDSSRLRSFLLASVRSRGVDNLG